MKLYILALFFIFSSIEAKEHRSWIDFCDEVPLWPDGAEVVANSYYTGFQVGTPVDAEYVRLKMKDDSWVLIDNRAANELMMGKIPKSYHLEADYLTPSKNRMNESNLIKILNNSFNHATRIKPRPIKSLKDLQGINFITLCNGRKCHRSSFAACELRRMGIPFENVFIYLGGYPEWREKGFPIR